MTLQALVRARSGAPINVPSLSELPEDALLTDRQLAAHSGFTVAAFKKWRREKRGPKTVYLEGKPRVTVGSYRAWIAGQNQAVA